MQTTDVVAERLEEALDAVIAADREGVVAATRALAAQPEATFQLLSWVAYAALQNIRPGGPTPGDLAEMSQALRGTASPWASIFDPGALETVAGVIGGDGTSLDGVPREQMLPGLLAVAAYAVVKPVPTPSWFDWRQHYRAVVASRPAAEQPPAS